MNEVGTIFDVSTIFEAGTIFEVGSIFEVGTSSESHWRPNHGGNLGSYYLYPHNSFGKLNY